MRPLERAPLSQTGADVVVVDAGAAIVQVCAIWAADGGWDATAVGMRRLWTTGGSVPTPPGCVSARTLPGVAVNRRVEESDAGVPGIRLRPLDVSEIAVVRLEQHRVAQPAGGELDTRVLAV